MAERTDVPIYILGSSTDSAHLAASEGLPYAFASHFASTHLMNALAINRDECIASEFWQNPYCIAGVNVIVADTDEEAQQLFTTLIRMFVGVLTGSRQALQPPIQMNEDLEETLRHLALHQMLRYSFVGSKATVKRQLNKFIQETQVDEIITACAMYAIDDRIKSIQLFGEVMAEINEERALKKEKKVSASLV